MKTISIFITYNPKNQHEQILAARLHTIGAVNGFRMLMPDRFNSESVVDNETVSRINESDYFVLFLIGKLSEIVRQEINIAIQNYNDKRKIIVIYEKNKTNLKSDLLKLGILPFGIDPHSDSHEKIIEEILTHIRTVNLKEENQVLLKENKKLIEENKTLKAIGALLGIGLGLLILDSLVNNK